MSTTMPARPHTKWPLAVIFAIGGAVLVGVVVLAFLWPVATSSAQNLPVAIAGPASQISAVESTIDSASADLLDFTTVDDRAAAVSSIEQRETSGAIVVGTTPEVLVASAGNATATALLRTLAVQLQATVTDVVPLSADDPNGAGLTSAAFPLVLGGMLGGILISLLVVGVLRRLTALLVYGVAAGLILATVMQPLFGILQGNFIVNAAALALSMLGTASLIVGFTALVGPRGIALGSVITMLIANPISGATLPLQFIAGPWGQVGQYFVPGAASSLIRELSYFPEANSTMQWLVLASWAVAGLLFSILGHFRSRAPIPLPASELEPEHEARHVAV